MKKNLLLSAVLLIAFTASAGLQTSIINGDTSNASRVKGGTTNVYTLPGTSINTNGSAAVTFVQTASQAPLFLQWTTDFNSTNLVGNAANPPVSFWAKSLDNANWDTNNMFAWTLTMALTNAAQTTVTNFPTGAPFYTLYRIEHPNPVGSGAPLNGALTNMVIKAFSKNGL